MEKAHFSFPSGGLELTTPSNNAASSAEIRGIIEKLNNIEKEILTLEEIDMILELLEKTKEN
jgi:hypothetical protein